MRAEVQVPRAAPGYRRRLGPEGRGAEVNEFEVRMRKERFREV